MLYKVLEKGLNRKQGWQIEQDSMNQSAAAHELMNFFRVDIETQEPMNVWDWEFYREGNLIAIGEYRRRFNNFGTYPDFQFGHQKFLKMQKFGQEHNIPAYMFVEFDDLFLYFPIAGSPEIKTMKRNHEIRTEQCVCIPNADFIPVMSLSL
jgi:hypothetical protein